MMPKILNKPVAYGGALQFDALIFTLLQTRQQAMYCMALKLAGEQ